MYRFYKKNPTKTSLNAIRCVVIFCVFLLSGIRDINAQSTANYTFATAASGSLATDLNSNTVDMTTGVTNLYGAGVDVYTATLQTLPFEFWFMGTRYTQYSVNPDGALQFGGTAITTHTSSSAAATPIINLINVDCKTATTVGGVDIKTVGTTPNRTLVIQWKNLVIPFGGTSNTNYATFQLRLYETTGVIEMVYGQVYNNTSASQTVSAFISSSNTAGTIGVVKTISGTPTYDATVTSNTTTSMGANSAMTNLNSTTNGSRRFFKFTPPTPTAAPTNLTFTNVAATSMTLNWTDNASNETGYPIYFSTDGTNYNYLGIAAVNSTSTNITGLAASTNYFWKVYAVTEGVLSTAVTGTQATNSNANHLVISQVYGGGGNAGASYQNDFVELFNPTGSAVSVNGWSIQYIASSGTVFNGVNLPNVSIPAGAYFLAKLATGGAVGAALPTADVTGTRDMAVTNGTAVLVNSTTLITNCSQASVIDLVGYGTTASTWCYEGTGATGTTSSTNSAFRKNGGCTDGNNNTNDFTIAAVSPRNSSTAVNYCYATKLNFTTPSDQIVSVPFSITVNSTDAGGNIKNVSTNTLVTLTSNGNAGAIGGTTTGTITAGTSSVTFSGVTFPSIGTNVTITATATTGQALLPFICGTFNVTGGAPTITSLGSSSGCVGTSITINGTNLTGATAANVKIGGTAVSSITSNSGTVLVAVIGSGTTGNVTVTIGANTATSPGSFTVNPLPTAPGNPTSNSPQCTSPGVTLTRTGAPSGGDIWYWQTVNNNQAATANFADTYIVSTSGTYYINAKSTAGCWSATSGSLAVTVVPAVPSISANPSNASVVGGGNASFTAAASNSPTSFIWEVNDGTGWSTVTNGGVYSTATTATLNITAATFTMNGYLYRATAVNACGNSTPSTNATLTVTYCAPSYGTGCAGDYISNVTFTGINNTTGCTGSSPTYLTYYSTPNPNIMQGSSYSLSVTTGGDLESVSAFIDFNGNGIFTDASETVISSQYAGTNPATYTTTVNVPAGATIGSTRTRIRCRYSNNTIDPCSAYTYGEVEDYAVTVIASAIPTITSLGSSSGCVGTSITINGTNLTGATAANVKIGGTAVTSITTNTATQIVAVIGSGTTGNVTVTIGANTATSPSSFTVNQLPSVGVNSPSICSGNSTSLTGTGAASYAWTGGLSGSPTATTPTLSATTTYTVTGTGANGCTNTAVSTVTVTSLPSAPTGSASQTVCTGATVADLTATGTSIKWYDAGGAGANLLSSSTVLINGTHYFASQTISCESTSRLDVTVTIASASVTSTTPGNRCGTGTVGLAATGSAGTTLKWYDAPTAGNYLAAGTSFTTPSITTTTPYYAAAEIGGGVATIGAGGSATTGSGVVGGSYISPFSHYFGGYKSQYLIKASELTVAGLSAGNITAMSLYVTSAGTTYNGFALNIGSTAATALTTTFATPSFTNVYNGNITPTVGTYTINFSSSFAWDGTSNIIVQLCWSNNNTGGAAAEVKYDATSYVSPGSVPC